VCTRGENSLWCCAEGCRWEQHLLVNLLRPSARQTRRAECRSVGVNCVVVVQLHRRQNRCGGVGCGVSSSGSFSMISHKPKPQTSLACAC
jgi:hypothetical protein